MRRHLINLSFFLVSFAATVWFGANAYASTATGQNISVTFEGDTCDDLRSALTRMHFVTQPNDASDFRYFLCDEEKLVNGKNVTAFWRTTAPLAAGADVFAMTDVGAKLKTYDYLGFVALAGIFGVGVMAGKQR